MEEEGTTVPEGIVIHDVNGNQFVWIPVGRVYTVSYTHLCIITGLNFAHSNYQKNGDKEKMLICDKLIGLIDDIDVFLEKKENLKDEKEKNEI